ncbi:methionyl-tRNA formyltransferase [Paracoccus sp. T5]|uniref:methionyl-tRNA formyltransferase n=1 Tax=Paracoccus sp. T5 TaxID=3402161 RepID=UPI003AED86BC
MRVIFMGTPDFSVPALRAVAAAHEVVAVYTQPPRAAGRGQQARRSPVHVAAEGLGLPVRHPARLRDPDDQAAFAALDADVAVVVAYGLILPQPVLDAPRLGCVNIHASILPRWRGAAPIHRAIMAGDAETGVAIMQMEAGLDTGPVLVEARTPIGTEETTADLHDRLAGMGADLIADVLDRLPLEPVPQPREGVTYAAKIDKAEARIDWTRPAAEVDRQIRGLSPFPGAWCEIAGERVKLLRSRLAEGSGAPGAVIGAFTIACGQGAVQIREAQRAGKRPMMAEELLRGWELPARLD